MRVLLRSLPVYLFVFVLIVFTPFIAAHAHVGDAVVGQEIPHDLSVKDQSGAVRSFDDLKGDNGLVLAFVRSAEWCPFCQKQLIDINSRAEEFKQSGYGLATVSYDNVDTLAKFSTKNEIGYTMLSDQGSNIIRAFGILNETIAGGTFAYGIAYPGIYVIDNDGKVQQSFFEDDYKDRPDLDKVLQSLSGGSAEEASVVEEAAPETAAAPAAEVVEDVPVASEAAIEEIVVEEAIEENVTPLEELEAVPMEEAPVEEVEEVTPEKAPEEKAEEKAEEESSSSLQNLLDQ